MAPSSGDPSARTRTGLPVITSRVPGNRDVITGRPVLVLADGSPDEAAMRRQRLSVADLLVAAREQGIRRTSDIEYAVLEADGRISFFTRESDDSSGAPDKPPQG